ncbi:F-box/FBD/LRR-repeat protein At1g13570-like [Mercurialis annua]|uniref:F-box/FBD/LRR-repeat protein At1g13570-like n=1 Tax=Mercurialis annua TaxID=3986 RepID=UPI00215F2D64|nr:F-box/FBD/LRR-repeat protein At1g13570-like [Mercurialis annua]XP_050223285.1 F-box/FBD/LRR-repeat protein At1g13570-like [Mercurialis annua]
MDNQSTKRIVSSLRSDRVSELPSNIIDNILICLPIHEAVKTCILSKSWRFRWRYLPKLIFDDTFYQRLIRPSISKRDITKLFSIIYRVLLLHRGSILNFTYRVPLFSSPRGIHRLMFYLSEKDVHGIVFDFGESLYDSGYKIERLPSFLFSCVTLRSLTLSSCTVTVPLAFKGFPKLISLTFDSFYFYAKGEVETFISKCPLLERLSIKYCDNIDTLDIDIPYLKFFQFSSSSCKAICFRKTSQHLSTVIFDEEFGGPYHSEPTKLFECLAVVKHFRLGYDFLHCLFNGRMPMKLSLGGLRVLELPEICFGRASNISYVLCLIVNSPNLKKLEIGSLGAGEDMDPIAPELLKVKDLLDNALKKLRVVKMNFAELRVKQAKHELDFIKFLLAESIVLEKMYIQPAKGTVCEEELKILKKVLRFHRSSKKAEIVALNPVDGEVSSE